MVSLIPEFCNNCGERILTMTFRGENYCSDDCRKALHGDDVDEIRSFNVGLRNGLFYNPMERTEE